MTKLLDTIDELNKGQALVRAAYMAAHGANGLASEERNAMAHVLGDAQDALKTVEASLDEMLDEERAKAGAD